MVQWAASRKYPGIGFLCICVDPDARNIAKEFGNLYFGSAPESFINGFIEDKSDFPNFQAQLGCQGFIIFNSEFEIVIPRTKPWMQHRDGAFRDLENKLSHLLERTTLQNPLKAPLGQQMRIVNLTGADGTKLNGLIGKIVGSTTHGKYLVKVDKSRQGGARKKGKKLTLSAENLEDATDAPIGKIVQVTDLTNAKDVKLNGQTGEVLGGAANGSWIVKLGESTTTLRKENLKEQSNDSSDDGICFSSIASVGHATMDAQHKDSMSVLAMLYQQLSVQTLRQAQQDLAAHFAEEEALLREAGFGGAEGGGAQCNCNNDFSALGSHIADHKRMIALANDTLSEIGDVCNSSDAYGSIVPKELAVNLCKAFTDHAAMYDSLYEGKLLVQTDTNELP